VSGVSAASGRERPVKTTIDPWRHYRLWERFSTAIYSVVHHLQVSRTSAASGQKTASLIKKKKLMNVEHRTSNIERRIMHSIYFKTTERPVGS